MSPFSKFVRQFPKNVHAFNFFGSSIKCFHLNNCSQIPNICLCFNFCSGVSKEVRFLIKSLDLKKQFIGLKFFSQFEKMYGISKNVQKFWKLFACSKNIRLTQRASKRRSPSWAPVRLSRLACWHVREAGASVPNCFSSIAIHGRSQHQEIEARFVDLVKLEEYRTCPKASLFFASRVFSLLFGPGSNASVRSTSVHRSSTVVSFFYVKERLQHVLGSRNLFDGTSVFE